MGKIEASLKDSFHGIEARLMQQKRENSWHGKTKENQHPANHRDFWSKSAEFVKIYIALLSKIAGCSLKRRRIIRIDALK